MTDNFSIEHEQDALAELDKIKEQFKQSSPGEDLGNSSQENAFENDAADEGASYEESAVLSDAPAAAAEAIVPAAAAKEGIMEKLKKNRKELPERH